MLLPKVSFGLLKVGAVSGLTASLWRAERCVRRFSAVWCGLVLFALVVVAVEGGGLPVRQWMVGFSRQGLAGRKNRSTVTAR